MKTRGAHGVGDGARAHGWADTMLGATAGLEVRFAKPLRPESQRLMDTLGVRVVIDPTVPEHCCVKPSLRRRGR